MADALTSPPKSPPNSARFTFTDDQLAELKECFILFDQNNKGSILPKDLGSALRAMGQNPSQNDVTTLLQTANLDDDGCLSLGEYLRVVNQYTIKDEQVMRDELVEAMRVFDRQDTGQLDVTELKEALRNLGEGLTEEDLEEIMTLANVKENGTFDYMELVEKVASN